jgi:hypothetical protein
MSQGNRPDEETSQGTALMRRWAKGTVPDEKKEREDLFYRSSPFDSMTFRYHSKDFLRKRFPVPVPSSFRST